jgi:hypothetical protein
VPDGTPVPVERGLGHYEQTARPGARAPHVPLADGTSTIDWFGRGFTLCRFADVDVTPIERAARERGVPLKVVESRDERVRAAYDRDLVLVRPDGHVAWRSNEIGPDPAHLIDRIRGAETADLCV